MLFYAGIGSRQTPRNTMLMMREIAKELAKRNYILRSGAAEGADQSFEHGADEVKGKKEIFLPWPGFNQHTSSLCNPTKAAFDMAQTLIPWWDRLDSGPRKLHARNCHQVMGYDLRTPVQFVLCWTDNGEPKGGTRTAIMCAELFRIPVINLFHQAQMEDDLVDRICKKGNLYNEI